MTGKRRCLNVICQMSTGSFDFHDCQYTLLNFTVLKDITHMIKPVLNSFREYTYKSSKRSRVVFIHVVLWTGEVQQQFNGQSEGKFQTKSYQSNGLLLCSSRLSVSFHGQTSFQNQEMHPTCFTLIQTRVATMYDGSKSFPNTLS